MWILDRQTKSFQAKTTVAPGTNLSFNIIYKTKTPKAETNDLPYSDSGSINETYSDIVTPPYGDSIKKRITYVQVYNTDVIKHEVTFALLDNGTTRVVYSCELDPKWTVEYSEDGRWTVYDETGVKKKDNDVSRKITKIDEASATITYIGKAVPGTADSDPLWFIQRVDSSVTPITEILFADGDSNEDNVWDDRTSLTYA